MTTAPCSTETTVHRVAARTTLALAAAPVLLLPACGTGSDDPTISVPAATQPDASTAVRTLPPSEALALIEAEGPTVLDVRTPQEYTAGHLTAARNLALDDYFATAAASLPRTGTYVLYCASGTAPPEPRRSWPNRASPTSSTRAA